MRFLSILAAFALSFFIAGTAHADRYEFDHSHTTILFHINHLGFSDMIGEITNYDGFFTFNPKAPQQSVLDVTLKPESIHTSSEALDKELQSEKFFNTGKFPDIHFVSKAITVTGENTADILGDLSMLGLTNPVMLHVIFNKADYHPITQNFIAGFSATTTIKRSDYGMKYLLPLVGDEVRIEIQTEGINIDRKKMDAIKKQ